MKILKINDRGIKIIEDGEVINQGLFSEEKDIPTEIYELLSIYDDADEIKIEIEIEISNEILNEINLIISNKGWKIKKEKKISVKTMRIVLGILIFEVLIGTIFFIKNSIIKKDILDLKKTKLGYTKDINEINIKIKEIPKLEEKNFQFIKNNITEILKQLTSTCKILNINLEKIEFKDKSVYIFGYGDNAEKIIELKKYLIKKNKKEAKFDFIKKEGDSLYFSMELKIL